MADHCSEWGIARLYPKSKGITFRHQYGPTMPTRPGGVITTTHSLQQNHQEACILSLVGICYPRTFLVFLLPQYFLGFSISPQVDLACLQPYRHFKLAFLSLVQSDHKRRKGRGAFKIGLPHALPTHGMYTIQAPPHSTVTITVCTSMTFLPLVSAHPFYRPPQD